MLLSERIRHRLRQEGRLEGREEGREEERLEGREEERRKYASAITAWYERQQQALERGEEFNEPPPGIRR